LVLGAVWENLLSECRGCWWLGKVKKGKGKYTEDVADVVLANGEFREENECNGKSGGAMGADLIVGREFAEEGGICGLDN
jgi:hypothetical protein